MQTKEENRNRIIKCVACYVFVLLAVILTPMITRPMAEIFHGVTLTQWDKEKGKLCAFFADLLTCVFWLLELLILRLLYLSYKKEGKAAKFIKKRFPKLSADISKEMALAKERKEGKQGLGFLPFRNIVFLFFITAFCVVWLSAQIDFEVKPFHDFGKKIEPVRMMKVGSWALVSVVKSVWIVWALRFGYRISELVLSKLFKTHTTLVWVGTCFFSLIFGILDILLTDNTFVWTYLVFYLMFVAVYYFTERNGVKAFWFIFFIYIF